MPYILLDGCETDKIVRSISITVKVDFRKDFFREFPERYGAKLDLLEEQLGEVLKKWFNDYECEHLSNHEYNCKMNNH